MKALDQAVRKRADNRCEYCRFPQEAFSQKLQIEHIIARQHGGLTHLENLALACQYCNLKKGTNLAGIDPATGLILPLFHPRNDLWKDHFSLGEGINLRIKIVGITPTGRATARLFGMNDDPWPRIRYKLWLESKF